MKLTDALPNVNPDGDIKVCHDVWETGMEINVFVLCDRSPRHTGKHMHRSAKGRTEWWQERPPSEPTW